jgi:hypothetical protein
MKKNGSQVGLQDGETRATFIIDEEQLEKVKAIAYWDRDLIKNVLNKALNDYFDKRQNITFKAVKMYIEDKFKK